MNAKHKFSRRLLSVLLCIALLLPYLPFSAIPVDAVTLSNVDKVVDTPTVNSWQTIFNENSTENAGGVWTDKSVFESVQAYLNATAENENYTLNMLDEKNNFLVSLSAIASSKSITGYATTPTDTVLILDMSSSMISSSYNNIDDLAVASNNAIKKLLALNKNNRVAVVLYSGAEGQNGGDTLKTRVLMPLDTYTPDSKGNFIEYKSNVSIGNNRTREGLRVVTGVKNSKGETNFGLSNNQSAWSAGTFTQDALHVATNILLEAEQYVVGEGNVQEGQERMPIMVLMTDGEPSVFSTDYAGVGTDGKRVDNLVSRYTSSTTSTGKATEFMVQLTAAYSKYILEQKYQENDLLFYTLGLQGNSRFSTTTLEPEEHRDDTVINGYWDHYLNDNTFKTLRLTNNTVKDFAITTAESIRAPFVAKVKSTADADTRPSGLNKYRYYVDKYFEATTGTGSNNLVSMFDSIVDEIILQSKYYPTKVESGSDINNSGYVVLVDTLGKYMELKELKNIQIGENIYHGRNAAKEMSEITSSQNLTGIKKDLFEAVTTRLKISDATALEVIKTAQTSGKLYYNSDTDFNNAIGWYGNYTSGTEDPKYVAAWNGDENAQAPAGANCTVESYYFYGLGNNVHQIGDMRYIKVEVVRFLENETNFSGQTKVRMRIPASLIPLTTYEVQLDGSTLDSKVENMTMTGADAPIRLLYEVGLKDSINSYNVAYLAKDAYNEATGKYDFYSNKWDYAGGTINIGVTPPRDVGNSYSYFEPSGENEYLYYQFDTTVYTKSGNNYVPYTGTAKPTGPGYYGQRYVYTKPAAGQKTTPTSIYYPIGIQHIVEAEKVTTGNNTSWILPKGTHALEDGSKVILYKDGDTAATADGGPTGTYKTSSTYFVEHDNANGVATYHMEVALGNNGRLSLTAENAKTVSIDSPINGQIPDGDGELVTIGDVLTYKVKVGNRTGKEVTATVTDIIPAGTTLVENSISDGGTVSGGKITWSLTIPANVTEKEVSFKVTVTKDALTLASDTIDNTASVKIGNDPWYDTNTVKNYPEGKSVTYQEKEITTGVKVGEILRFAIDYANNTESPATVVITDKVPEGTRLQGLASDITDNGVYDKTTNTITWTLKNVQAGKGGQVAFYVVVTEQAVTPIANTATIKVGDNDSKVTVKTNTTETDVLTGDVQISKVVVDTTGGTYASNQVFKLNLATAGASMTEFPAMSGTYIVTGSSRATSVTFTNGKASLEIKHGETITIKGLPAGLQINVEETNKTGFSPAYSVTNETGTISTKQIRVVAGTTPVKMTITNTYDPVAVNVTITGNKKLTTVSGYLGNATFDFELFEAYEDGRLKNNTIFRTATATINSGTNLNNVNFNFAPISYDNVGTHYYVVKEVTSVAIQGVTYDMTQYLVKVVVEIDSATGMLKTTKSIVKTRQGDTGNWTDSSLPQDIVYTNEYEPTELTLNLTATKVLTGRDLEDKGYSFVVKENGNIIATGTNDKNGKVTFTPITFYIPGEHTYKVSEVNANKPNIAYDSKEYTVYVNVVDNNGKLEISNHTVNSVNVEVDETSLGTFSNIYTPDSVAINLSATKYLQNGNLKDSETTPAILAGGEFSFIVDQVDNDGNLIKADVSTAANAASSTTDANKGAAITFPAINYAVSADSLKDENYTGETLYFKIREAKPTVSVDPYMNYDDSEWNVTVQITYDRGTGKLTVGTPVYTKSGTSGNATFTNIKYPDSITVTPVGTKLTTTEGTLPSGINFSITVREVDTGKTVATGIALGSTSDSEIEFSSLSLANSDSENSVEYKYWIYESNAGSTTNGITYDENRYLMKVTVTNTNGKLSATTEYFKAVDGAEGSPDVTKYTVAVTNDSIKFENQYDAKGYLTLTAQKDYKDGDVDLAISKDQFAFRIQRMNNDGTVAMNKVVNGLSAQADAGSDAIVNFATMYYTKSDTSFANGYNNVPGLIHYVVSEIDLGQPGVTYDSTHYNIYVLLKDDGNGNITAKLANENGTVLSDSTDIGYTFKNTYATVTGTQATITVEKELKGRPTPLEDGEFTFELYLVSPTQKYFVASAKNDADGKVEFVRNYPATVAPGTYKYEIVELDSNASGIRYDKTVHTVYVKIEEDIDTAALVAKVSTKENSTEYVTPVFTNHYKAAGTSITPEATKKLDGRPLNDNEFAFQIKSLNSSDLDKVVDIGYNVNNDVVFSKLYFNAAGTYKYEISEVHSSLGGIKYDTTKYYLKVTVVDNNEGALKATAQYYTDVNMTTEIAVDKVVFNNEYKVANGVVQLEANKVLTGRENEMEVGEFEFVVTDLNGTVVTTGENIIAGTTSKVIFGSIGYSHGDLDEQHKQPDGSYKYKYIMKEIVPENTNGIKYDLQKCEVVVTITEDGYGVMETSVTYDGKEEIPTFTNTYKADNPAKITVEAFKRMVGKKLIAGAFTFQLLDGDKVVATATNMENGKVVFDEIKLDTAGTHVFTLKEVNGVNKDKENAKGDFTTDTTVYKVEVVVKDDGIGNLYVESLTYKLGDKKVDNATFVNYYMPASLETDLPASIDASKTILLDGTKIDGTLFENQFEFAVTDSNGNEVKDINGNVIKGYNDKDGNIQFTGNFFFDADGEYRYWIKEVVDADKDYFEYDARAWEIRIYIDYDNVTGSLKLGDVQTFVSSETRTTEESAPEFVNTYNPEPVSLTFTADKLLKVVNGTRTLTEGEFKFQVIEKIAGKDIVRAEATNDSDGKVVLTFTESKVGEHTYYIKEVVPEYITDGVTYDAKERIVTVKVEDDGTGQLKIGGKSTYTKAVLAFENVYTVDNSDPVTILADKILTGKELSAGAFEFYLVEDKENGIIVATAKNDADGKITFVLPEYTSVGTYNYLLKEAKGTDATITYDESVIKVTVTVVDNWLGKLVATVDYSETPVFENTYTEPIPPYNPEEAKDVTDGTSSINKQLVSAGQTLTYVVDWANLAGAEGTVIITDAIPEGTTYVEGSASNKDNVVFKDNTLTWTFENQKASAIGTVSFQVTVNEAPKGAVINNKATVKTIDNTSNVETKVETNETENYVPGKSVDVAMNETVQLDKVVTFTITYYNPTDAAADIIITDVLDDNLDFVSADGAVYTEGNRTITWTISNVESGKGGSVTVSAKLNTNALNEETTNQASVMTAGHEATTNIVTIPKAEKPEPTPTVTPSPTPIVPVTGDDTVIWPFILICVVAAGVMVGIVVYQKKKTNK